MVCGSTARCIAFFPSMCGGMGTMIALYAVTLHNPVKKIRSHKALRGMSWRIDIKDWLGGYPYEYASVAEIFAFLEPRGFTLKNLISTNGLRNNEFLFVRGAHTPGG